VRFPRPSQVPATAGVSGIVFVLGVFFFGNTNMLLKEGIVFGAWGLMYLSEWGYRAVKRRRSVEGDVQACAALDDRGVDATQP
jgi:hypothetical protein